MPLDDVSPEVLDWLRDNGRRIRLLRPHTAMSETEARLLEVLGDLERAEARLLAWGVVDGAMSEDEILGLIEEARERHGLAELADNILEELIERRLVFEVDDIEGYRTRMAEAVRLFARLRQWMHGRTWLDAPTLVADFRFDLRPRAYPRRNIAATDAIDVLSTHGDISPTCP